MLEAFARVRAVIVENGLPFVAGRWPKAVHGSSETVTAVLKAELSKKAKTGLDSCVAWEFQKGAALPEILVFALENLNPVMLSSLSCDVEIIDGRNHGHTVSPGQFVPVFPGFSVEEKEKVDLIAFVRTGLSKKMVKQRSKRRRLEKEEECSSNEKQGKSRAVPESLLAMDNAHSSLPFIEIEHVKNVYDSIASHWHGTRYKPWPRVEAFIGSLEKGSLISDFGCGNGKNLAKCAETGLGIGCDFSSSLINICNDLGHEVVVADATQLPFRDGIFDALLSIAVLHHISSEERRLKLLEESMRTLRIGGQGLFYAWAQEQDEGVSGHRFETSDVFVPWHLRNRMESQGSSSEVFQRYCHVYTRGELESLFEKIPWIVVLESYYDCGNWCVKAMRQR